MAFRTQEEEGALDNVSLDDFLIENKEATFMLRAKSDAMKDAGILSGDLIIVDRSKESRPGDIVIVVQDDAFKMGYAHTFQNGEKVEAVVSAVVRKY